jgi:hypothetical protein
VNDLLNRLTTDQPGYTIWAVSLDFSQMDLRGGAATVGVAVDLWGCRLSPAGDPRLGTVAWVIHPAGIIFLLSVSVTAPEPGVHRNLVIKMM